MSPGVALVVGTCFGFLVMLCVTLWVVVRGNLPMAVAYGALATMVVGSIVLAIASGNFKSGIVLMLGIAVGLALSSIVTLPLGALAHRRHRGGTPAKTEAEKARELEQLVQSAFAERDQIPPV